MGLFKKKFSSYEDLKQEFNFIKKTLIISIGQIEKETDIESKKDILQKSLDLIFEFRDKYNFVKSDQVGGFVMLIDNLKRINSTYNSNKSKKLKSWIDDDSKYVSVVLTDIKALVNNF